MGCLKLTYHEPEATLRVVHNRMTREAKSEQSFLSVDPLAPSYPWYTPYQFAGNKPIWAIDLDGLEEVYVNRRGFFIDAVGESSFGTYMGNVKPLPNNPSSDELYMELVRIDGKLYHKHTDNIFARGTNFVNKQFGGSEDYWVQKKPYSVEEETRNDVIREGVADAIYGKILGESYKFARQFFKVSKSLWKLPAKGPNSRGFVYEKMLGLKGLMKTDNFPVIDAFYKGVATSVKTLDLHTVTYKKSSAIYSKLKKYVDDLDNFKDTTWGGQTVLAKNVKEKVLELGIPKGATEKQIAAITRATKYAEGKGIKFNVRVVK